MGNPSLSDISFIICRVSLDTRSSPRGHNPQVMRPLWLSWYSVISVLQFFRDSCSKSSSRGYSSSSPITARPRGSPWTVWDNWALTPACTWLSANKSMSSLLSTIVVVPALMASAIMTMEPALLDSAERAPFSGNTQSLIQFFVSWANPL